MSESRKRLLANGLRLLFALGGAILVARTLWGPLSFPVPVRSPINLEGWLVVAAGLLIVIGWRAAGAKRAQTVTVKFGRLDLWMALSLAALIVVVFAGSRNDYFLADDFLLLKYARDFTFDLHRELTTPGGDGFFRPVTHFVFGVIYRWADFDPLRWHLAGFGLHAVNTALVFTILRRMDLARTPAWLASALFAIHATRPEAVVWVGGRFDLVATFFVLLSVAMYLTFLDSQGAVRWVSWSAALVATALGILSKESAYSGPPILLVIALTRGNYRLWPASWRKMVLELGPFFAVAAGLFAYRWVLFGSIGGYLDVSGRPQALLLSPVNVIKALAFRIWAVLVFPIDWNASATLAPGFLLGMAMVLYLIVLAWMTTARVPRRELFAPMGFVLLASIPPLQQLLIGPDMEKARYLYLPAVGFCWLLAVTIRTLEPAARRAVWAGILIFNLAAMENNLAAWHFASGQARSACIAAASCAREGNHRLAAIGLPRTVRGAPLFAWGFEDCTRMQMPDGAPLAVDLRDTPVSSEESAGYACVLEWDPAISEVHQIH